VIIARDHGLGGLSVDLLGLLDLFLFFVLSARGLFRAFRLFFIVVVRGADLRARTLQPHALFGGIEGGGAFGTRRRAATQIVKFRPAARARLLVAQIHFRQVRSPV